MKPHEIRVTGNPRPAGAGGAGEIELNGALTYKDLDELRRRAALLEEAVQWMIGRLDSQELQLVHAILTRPPAETK